MSRPFVLRLLAAILLLNAPLSSVAGSAKGCKDGPPSQTWSVDTPYPFQAGAEASFDELYHGPWRTKIAITLFSRPRSKQVTGTLLTGTVVEAMVGRTIVVHPLRFVADKAIEVTWDSIDGKMLSAKMTKGDAFWVLNSSNEGEFSVWWHCKAVGWDSTTMPTGLPTDQLSRLGTNQEEWVKIKDRKTGISGWFQQAPSEGEQLVPAVPTTKRTG